MKPSRHRRQRALVVVFHLQAVVEHVQEVDQADGEGHLNDFRIGEVLFELGEELVRNGVGAGHGQAGVLDGELFAGGAIRRGGVGYGCQRVGSDAEVANEVDVRLTAELAVVAARGFENDELLDGAFEQAAGVDAFAPFAEAAKDFRVQAHGLDHFQRPLALGKKGAALLERGHVLDLLKRVMNLLIVNRHSHINLLKISGHDSAFEHPDAHTANAAHENRKDRR